MIIVDSSVWIDFFNKGLTIESQILESLIKNGEDILIPDLVLIEVLQGFKSDKNFKIVKDIFENFEVVPVLESKNYQNSINNYRMLRKKGITVNTIDNLIATYCITREFSLLFSDKDYNNICKHLGLKNFTKECLN